MKKQERNGHKEQEKNNPCLKEQELTYKCFNDNNFNYDACQLEIENYKLCKAFWNAVQKERRKQGLKPLLPAVEDREKVKREYFEKFKP